MKHLNFILLGVIYIFMLISCNKKTNEEPAPKGSTSSKKGVLIIESGARRFEPGETASFAAHIVLEDGSVINANNVSWSSSSSSLFTVSSNTIACVGTGSGLLTASVNYEGTTLTASIPIMVSLPEIFSVLPGGIAWFADNTTIQLEPVYLGSDNPGPFTYISSNNSVATVSATGMVTCVGVGECVISVRATGLDGSPVFDVPVYLAGEIIIPIPVAKVEITPSSREMFLNDQTTLTAKAFDMADAEVSRTFSWTVEDNTILSVDANGQVTALKPGKSKVYASTDGIIGEAEVYVYPEKVIEVSPMIVSIAPNKTYQMVAKTYQVVKAGSGYTLNQISNPSDLKWEIPSFGIPEFDIATVDANGIVTVKSGAMAGAMTIIGVYSPSDLNIEPGSAVIEVDDCDCGVNSGTTSISTSQTSYHLTVMNPTAALNATTLPAGGILHYCVENPLIVSVDSNTGELIAGLAGTTKVTICDGNVSTDITVTVTW